MYDDDTSDDEPFEMQLFGWVIAVALAAWSLAFLIKENALVQARPAVGLAQKLGLLFDRDPWGFSQTPIIVGIVGLAVLPSAFGWKVPSRQWRSGIVPNMPVGRWWLAGGLIIATLGGDLAWVLLDGRRAVYANEREAGWIVNTDVATQPWARASQVSIACVSRYQRRGRPRHEVQFKAAFAGQPSMEFWNRIDYGPPRDWLQRLVRIEQGVKMAAPAGVLTLSADGECRSYMAALPQADRAELDNLFGPLEGATP